MLSDSDNSGHRHSVINWDFSKDLAATALLQISYSQLFILHWQTNVLSKYIVLKSSCQLLNSDGMSVSRWAISARHLELNWNVSVPWRCSSLHPKDTSDSRWTTHIRDFRWQASYSQWNHCGMTPSKERKLDGNEGLFLLTFNSLSYTDDPCCLHVQITSFTNRLCLFFLHKYSEEILTGTLCTTSFFISFIFWMNNFFFACMLYWQIYGLEGSWLTESLSCRVVTLHHWSVTNCKYHNHFKSPAYKTIRHACLNNNLLKWKVAVCC